MNFNERTRVAAGLALVVASIALCSQAAGQIGNSAQLRSAQLPEKFRKLDTNQDGYLSRSEVSQIRDYARAFEDADGNRDGRLDPDEFSKAEAIYQRIQASAYTDDSMLATKVKAALIMEPQLNSRRVSVETYRGRVRLSGFVDDERQRSRALQVASTVEGVIGVRDGLAVR